MLLCHTMFSCFRTQVVPESQSERYSKSELEAMRKGRLVWLLGVEYEKSKENERDITSLKISRDACREAETLLLKKNNELEGINAVLRANVMKMGLEIDDFKRQVNDIKYIVQYESGDSTRGGMELVQAIQTPMGYLRSCLMDPITLQLMKKPVFVTTGHTYGEESLKRYLQTKKSCPLTNTSLEAFGHNRGVPFYYLADHRLAQVCDAFSKLEAAIEAAIHPKTREFNCQAGASQLSVLE